MSSRDDTKPLYKDYLGVPVVLVGAGGIGSNALSVIVKAGVQRLAIWDDDKVEPVNLAMQNFGKDDFGKLKCEVLADHARRLNPDIRAIARVSRFSTGDYLDGIVIAGVDSMESRKTIFDAVFRQREQIPLYLDGRLSRKYPDYCELYAINPQDSEQVALYREWLFEDSGVHEPRPQTLAVHTPIILAGLMGVVLAHWVRDRRHPWKVVHYANSMHTEAYWSGKNEGARACA